MPKFSIYLFALLSFCCYGIQIIKPSRLTYNVRLGEIFIVELISHSSSLPWKYKGYNGMYNDDSIQFLRTEVVPFTNGLQNGMSKIEMKYNFYFKANKVTNECKGIRFFNKNLNFVKLNYLLIKVNII